MRLSVVVCVTWRRPPGLRTRRRRELASRAAEPSNLSSTLHALASQTLQPAPEIIVPRAATDEILDLSTRFPAVRFLDIKPESAPGSPEHIEELRAAGVSASQGEIVALLEDHVRPDPEWAEAIVEAHRQPFAAIGGAIENGIDRAWNWAIYFSDIGRYHNPLPPGESDYASVVNVSYKRSALERIAEVWTPRFNETAVHAALLASGEHLALSPKIVVRQYWPRESAAEAMRQFFRWGRSFGETRAKLARSARLLTYICLSPLIPVVLLFRSWRDTARKGRLVRPWLESLPASALLTVAWSIGELAGYLRPNRRAS